MQEPEINLIPRQEWFKNRVQAGIDELQKLKNIECWDTYKAIALELSIEIHYAVTEWEKYYK
jgi:hypothetical protein